MAILVAASMVMLLVVAAMILDFGLVRLDRQVNKSATDSAVAAGLRGFDQGDGKIYSYRGACAALETLKANEPKLSSLTWAACSDSTKLAKVCDASVPSTSADFSTTVGSYEVEIHNPYVLSTSGFPEEGLATLQNDGGKSGFGGCDQLAVIVRQTRSPGLGSLATSADLVSRVRSVGRVDVTSGGEGVALLLLDRTHCQVVQLAAGGGGADSHIRVFGSASGATPPQGGSIHADSDGSAGCSSSSPVFEGKAADGITALGSFDETLSGSITSVAGLTSLPATSIYDGSSRVYASAKNSAAGAAAALKVTPTGRSLVSRAPVDTRYLTGVTSAVSSAETNVFGTVTAANAVSQGYKLVSSCNPNATDLTGITSSSMVFVDCTSSAGYKGSLPILGKTVIFNGKIASSAVVLLPNASNVYVFGDGVDGIDASSGFTMNTGTTAASTCATSPLAAAHARLFIKSGSISANGGTLRLCHTTVFMMGGYSDACLPPMSPTRAPQTKPCQSLTTTGNGLIKIAGTAVQDWTAPNDYAGAIPDSDKETAWNNQEDLALWSESYGTGSDFQMSGNGAMNMVGVFMTPNAAPFVVKGGGSQTLTNAQYIATSFQLTGGATLEMRVDANNVISLPSLDKFQLVR